MKARLAVILIVVAIAAVAFVVLWFPSARPPAAPGHAPLAQRSQTGAPTPREAVVRYVEALYQKDFRAAHDLLSARSKEAHPFDDFVARAEAAGGPSLDLAAAREGKEENGRVVVSVPVEEDPAEAAFTTVREEGRWKVVCIGGAPWFPYPE
jgi:hypothetical protein